MALGVRLSFQLFAMAWLVFLVQIQEPSSLVCFLGEWSAPCVVYRLWLSKHPAILTDRFSTETCKVTQNSLWSGLTAGKEKVSLYNITYRFCFHIVNTANLHFKTSMLFNFKPFSWWFSKAQWHQTWCLLSVLSQPGSVWLMSRRGS